MRRLLPPIFVSIVFVIGVYFLWNHLPWLQQSPSGPQSGGTNTLVEGTRLEPPASYKTQPTVGSLAPDFEQSTLGGEEERLSDHLGTPVILTFWQTSCPFCVSNLSAVNRAALMRQSPVVILAVNKGEPAQVVQEFIKSHDPLPAARVILDIDGAISKKFMADALPRTFFIDQMGVVRQVEVGELSIDQINTALGALTEPAA
ncbi:MAG: TlpA disulfide reductase family protein [Patescibacteria group bacterium]|jgi:peroxiredoxin